MDGQETGKNNRWDRLKEDYKLVVFRSEDYSEVRSFNLSLANIYTWLSIGFLVVSILIISVIAFTPVKQWIPGYGEMRSNKDFIDLVQEVDKMSAQIQDQQAYITALQNLIAPADDSLGKGPMPSEVRMEVGIPVFGLADNTTRDKGILEKPLASTTALNVILGIRLISPIEGIVSSTFDPVIKHYGVDVLAPKNTPIRSIMDGFVISSGWDLETGYTIGIQHDENILSFYKHNSVLLKEKGTFVSAGEVVAIIGNTGTLSSGPHLHFELWHNGRAVNPEDFINFN